MKKTDILFTILACIAVLLCAAAVIDFLALHDIYNDYVSPSVLRTLRIDTGLQIPAWTRTELEWKALTISQVVKTAGAILNVVLIVLLGRILHQSAGKTAAQAKG